MQVVEMKQPELSFNTAKPALRSVQVAQAQVQDQAEAESGRMARIAIPPPFMQRSMHDGLPGVAHSTPAPAPAPTRLNAPTRQDQTECTFLPPTHEEPEVRPTRSQSSSVIHEEPLTPLIQSSSATPTVTTNAKSHQDKRWPATATRKKQRRSSTHQRPSMACARMPVALPAGTKKHMFIRFVWLKTQIV